MTNFNSVEPGAGSEEAEAALKVVEETFGAVPNLMKMIAAAPNVLQGIMGFNNSVASGGLSSALSERISLRTSALNGCKYCVAVHVLVGEQCGVSRAELIENMNGTDTDPKINAILKFVDSVIENRGKVEQAILNSLRDHGIDNAMILEILAVVGVYTFLNYAQHITQPVFDFPAISEFQPEKAGVAA